MALGFSLAGIEEGQPVKEYENVEKAYNNEKEQIVLQTLNIEKNSVDGTFQM
jgi:hypothetical protein